MQPADDLLTAREVQELLRLDRTTVYRMLKDGRLSGVKVGQQWRFPRRVVESLLGGDPPAPQAPDAAPTADFAADVLPLHCVQAIQDVFADLACVGAVTTAPDGQPLTAISNGCRFCALIQASPSGRAGCIASWRGLAERSARAPRIAACHAGLGYLHAAIEIDDRPIAMLVAGQFRDGETDVDVEALAAAHGLDAGELAAALAEVAEPDERTRAQLGTWLTKVARTFEQIGQERAAMLGRLRRIAALAMPDQPLHRSSPGSML